MLEKQKEQNKGTVEKTAALQVRNVLWHKILAVENFGKFDKLKAICQYFTQPNSIFTKVRTYIMLSITNSPTYSLAKILKQLICLSFTLPKF